MLDEPLQLRTSPDPPCTVSNGISAEIARFTERASSCSYSVVLLGETGVGKTHLARAIHDHSLGPRAPFIRVNCGAIPETLFEREMFGNVRGAYTDAREARPGLVEAANGGTLFLDEVGEIPLAAQCKLLAVLEDHRVRRLGSNQDAAVSFRVIAATNVDLYGLAKAGRFREDLYHRLTVLRFRLPSLRERVGDLPAMISEMLSRFAPQTDTVLTPAALQALTNHDWPGNIREMENAIRHSLLYANGGVIGLEHLPEEVRSAKFSGLVSPGMLTRRYTAPADPEEEVRRIQTALAVEGGNRTRTAKRLGMSRAALWTKLHRYQLVQKVGSARE